MIQPIKYLSLAKQLVQLYQQELIKFFRKMPANTLNQFKKTFDALQSKIKTIQTMKSINDDKISQTSEAMHDFLQKHCRLKGTSQSQRYNHRLNLRSQGQQRMRFTGQIKRQKQQTQNDNLFQIEEIMQSYKIEDGSGPRTRMKWRVSMDDTYKPAKQKFRNDTIGGNNIDLLSSTIPQIQNSIKRLSLQRSPKKSLHQRQRQIYRTLQSRGYSFRNQIPRLF